MIREIVLDTETTGMDPVTGDRIIEIGCVELVNHVQTGNHYHIYINPERDVPAEVVAVHGLTAEFLSDKKCFAEIYGEFLDFIGDARLVIHNAAFDMKFINHHLVEMGATSIINDRVVDTLLMARQKFPGSPASLDALCKRFAIDNSNRTLRGALLDSQLLADVYLELLGGRQTGLSFAVEAEKAARIREGGLASTAKKPVREARIFALSDDEAAAHQNMIDSLGDQALRKKLAG